MTTEGQAVSVATSDGTQTQADKDLFAHMDAEGKSGAGGKPSSPDPVPKGGKPSAPANGQTQDGGTSPDAAKGGDDADPAILSEEDFAKAAKTRLGLKADEPKDADHWKKQYAESSKEAKILTAQLGALRNALGKMGLDVVHGKEGLGFKANKDYTAKTAQAEAERILKGLSDSDMGKAMDNPKAFAELLAARLTEGMGPKPTVEKVEIDDTMIEQVRKTVAESKEGDEPELPHFKELMPFIEALLAESSEEAEAFRAFMKSSDKNYAFGLRLLHGRVFQRLSPLLQQQAEAKKRLELKKRNAEGDVSLASEGTQRGGGSGRKANSEAEEIAKAKPW